MIKYLEDLRFYSDLSSPKSVLLSTMSCFRKLIFEYIYVHRDMVPGNVLDYIFVRVLKNGLANKLLLVLKTEGKILTFSSESCSYKSISLST